MSSNTTPIFVIGSGRSGTRAVFKLLSGIDSIEIYHEYVCTHIQPLASLYYMKLLEKNEIKARFKELHGSAIHYSKAKYWVDCSNKLSWIIEPILEIYPNARFVNLVRDGRKVANSFVHKLGDEMYDDESVRVMREWLKNPKGVPMPPPEKKYWWNIPQKGQPFYEDFPSFDQFERASYHWRESNRVILESLKKVPKAQHRTYKLEELTSDRKVLTDFLSFFDLEYDEHFFEALQTPQNVVFPMDFELTQKQLEQFNRIASDMMEVLGYAGKPLYEVKY